MGESGHLLEEKSSAIYNYYYWLDFFFLLANVHYQNTKASLSEVRGEDK